MSKVVVVLSVLLIGVGALLYTEHNKRILVEERVETLTKDTEKLKQYIVERDNLISDINKKYQDILKKKPNDVCGDSVVSEDIIKWLKGDK